MIKCTLALCSQMAIIDAQTGGLTVINVIDDITVPVLPSVIPLSAVFIFQRDSEDSSSQNVIMTAGMTHLQRQNFPFPLDFSEKLTARSIASMQAVPIPAPGIFRVDVSLNETILAYWDINVKTVVSQPVFSTSSVSPISAPAPVTGTSVTTS